MWNSFFIGAAIHFISTPPVLLFPSCSKSFGISSLIELFGSGCGPGDCGFCVSWQIGAWLCAGVCWESLTWEPSKHTETEFICSALTLLYSSRLPAVKHNFLKLNFRRALRVALQSGFRFMKSERFRRRRRRGAREEEGKEPSAAKTDRLSGKLDSPAGSRVLLSFWCSLGRYRASAGASRGQTARLQLEGNGTTEHEVTAASPSELSSNESALVLHWIINFCF